MISFFLFAMTSSEEHDENVKILYERIKDAEAICVGAASGMSASGGHKFWYEGDETFEREFGAFAKKYGIQSAFSGFYYPFKTPEERWAYITTLVHLLYELPASQPYHDLHDILKGKTYFIVTTNQDRQFRLVFPENKIGTIQGDWGYFQCLNRCHDKVYFNKEQIYKMYAAIKDCKLPTEMLPRCPKCGGLMEPWVRGYDFLEGTKYIEEYRKWGTFIEENEDKKILFLELGVGRMTPMFIQHRFWNMVNSLPNAYYITINPNHAILPARLANKGHAIHEDIAPVFRDCLALMKKDKEKEYANNPQ